MSHRTERRATVARGVARPARWWGGPADVPDVEIMEDVSRLVRIMNADRGFTRDLARMAGTTLVLSATDTGRELEVMMKADGVVARPYEGGPYDVKIEATEEEQVS